MLLIYESHASGKFHYFNKSLHMTSNDDHWKVQKKPTPGGKYEKSYYYYNKNNSLLISNVNMCKIYLPTIKTAE